jgi:hypothetical protein
MGAMPPPFAGGMPPPPQQQPAGGHNIAAQISSISQQHQGRFMGQQVGASGVRLCSCVRVRVRVISSLWAAC